MPKKIILHSTYKNNWEIIHGTIPIIFSAPHAAPQTREGQTKLCDEFTGDIVRQLCAKTGAYGVVRTENCDDDPNFYNTGLSLGFKEEIINLIKDNDIKYGFDIHGCKDDLGLSIDIGTNYGKNINQNLDFLMNVQKNLSNDFGRVTIDGMFYADKKENVSTYISHETKIPYVQLETCRTLRENIEYIVDLLSNMVIELLG